MSLLDLVLILIVGGSVVSGFLSGFARAGVGFLAAIIGVLFGFWFYGIPAVWIHKFISSVAVSNLVGFLVVFVACLVLGGLIGKLLSKLFKWTGLSWLDRLMGAAFGLVRGGLITTAMVAILMAFTPRPVPNWMVDSIVLPYAMDASGVLAAIAPNAIKDAFRESVRDIRKIWDDQLAENRQKIEALKSHARKKFETEKKR